MSTERQKLLHVYHQMKSRCYVTHNPAYANYGARGIRVCPEWIDCFEAFLIDMGPRPPGGLLDRIDNNGPYSKENCRWATRRQQNSNRRNCIYVYEGDEKINLKEYCERRGGLSYKAITKRIRKGWSVDRAINQPSRYSMSKEKKHA